jgi:opacity protein-like surface antigen
MKTTLTFISWLTLAGSLVAGEPASTAVATGLAPTHTSCGWFLGGGAEYLLDAEEGFYSGHLGYDFGNGHSIFAEIGWTETEEDLVAPGGVGIVAGGVDVELMPVTLNYKYQYALTGSLGFYAGVGLGATYADMELGAAGAAVFGGPFAVSESDWIFTAQAFVGLVYNVSETFEIYGGVRYIWIDDSTIAGASVDDLDDFGVGIGVRFKF